MIMKPALVTILSVVGPQVPSPPSWPGAASATAALSASTQSVRRAVRTMAAEVTYPQLRWQSSSHPTSPRTWRESPCSGACRSSSSARTDDAVRAQRLGQDDAAADAQRRDRDRRRRARLPEGRAGLAARPAPAARPRPVAARLRALGLQGAARARGGAGDARGRDGRRRARRRDVRRLQHARRASSSTPAATTGASRSTRRCTGSGSATSTWTAASRRSPAASSPAPRWRARSRAIPTCCCSTSPPTTSTSQPRVAGDASAVARRRDRARRARPLVPGGRRHVGARARGRQVEVLQGHLARVARREGPARARARPR